jgi:hypothetical protein
MQGLFSDHGIILEDRLICMRRWPGGMVARFIDLDLIITVQSDRRLGLTLVHYVRSTHTIMHFMDGILI